MVNAKEILSTYLAENNHYRTSESPTDIDTNFDSDDEIYILQCPKTINPQQLKGAKIDIASGKCSLVDSENRPLECHTNSDEKLITIITPNNKMENLRTKGMIHVMERLPEKVFVKQEPIKTEFESIPLPAGLKERHPYFGVDYEKHLKLKKRVKVLLLEAKSLQHNQSQVSTSKLDRKRNHENDDTSEMIIKQEKHVKKSRKIERLPPDDDELSWIKTI